MSAKRWILLGQGASTQRFPIFNKLQGFLNAMGDITTLSILKSILAVLCIITVVLILNMLMFPSRDDFTDEIFARLNRSSSYTLESDETYSSGQLGHFYDCLNEKKECRYLQRLF